MRPRVYPALREAVEVGAAYGVRRAHKHVEHPTHDEITNAVIDAIMNELCERFHIEDEEEETK